MNNTKAIALLRRMQEPEAYEPQITAEAFEALGMAITALEQPSFPQRHENDHFAEASKKATQPEQLRTQMSSADCISRQAAIDALCRDFCGGYEGCKYYPKCENLKAIELLPSAQPEVLACGSGELVAQLELRWIPCSDHMPDQYGNYLISIEGDEPDIGTINPNDPRGWSLCDANGFYWASDKHLNITAWMPLPEPWKEGDE